MRSIRYYLTIIFLILLCSCGSQLRKDFGQIAWGSNFYSAEFKACGSLFQGLGACLVKSGDSYSNFKFSIQGYNYGTLKLSSSGCKLSQDIFRYSDNQIINIKILGSVVNSCFIQFVVQPEYSNSQTQDLVLEDFKGALYLKSTKESQESLLYAIRLKQYDDYNISIPSNDEEARVVFFSDKCNVNFDQVIQTVKDNILINVKDISSSLPRIVSTCLISGASISKSKTVRISILISVYDEKYQRLEIPFIKLKSNKIYIDAGPNVSIISLNDKYKIDNKAKFKFNIDKKNIVRVLTVNGRSRIGIWNPNIKSFKWK